MSYLIENETPLREKRNDLAVFVAKFYLICMTFKMIAPLRFLESIVGGAAISFDIIPHFCGVFIILIRNKGKLSIYDDEEGYLLSYFIKMVIWFSISSVIMAVIIQQLYGNLGSESAYRGIIGMLLYWAQYAFILYYNYHVFRILTITEMEKILKLEILILMIVGYIQMAVMLVGRQIGTIYNRIDILNILNDANRLAKLSLTGTEGAYAGYIMGTLVFPLLYALNLAGKSKGNLFFHILLWIPLVYMTYSSAAYILFVVTTAAYVLYYIKTRGLGQSFIAAIIIIILVALCMVLFGNEIIDMLPEEISNNIKYLLFEKIQDNDNGSTVWRSVPLYYNWGAFTEFPLIGVGNGLQGYFLEKYFPTTMRTVKGIDAAALLKSWTSRISNGSVFWPSILSGYGIVGIVLVLIYIVKSERLIQKKNKELGVMYFMYRLSIFTILFAGFATDFVAKYYIWFAISIPLIPASHGNHIDSDDFRIQKKNECKYIR